MRNLKVFLSAVNNNYLPFMAEPNVPEDSVSPQRKRSREFGYFKKGNFYVDQHIVTNITKKFILYNQNRNKRDVKQGKKVVELEYDFKPKTNIKEEEKESTKGVGSKKG